MSEKRHREVLVIEDSDEEREEEEPAPAKRPSPAAGGEASGGAAGGAVQLLELKGDLFSVPSTTSLAHCVAQDMRLGKGIATAFRDKFGGLEELRTCGARVGEARRPVARWMMAFRIALTSCISSGSYPTLATMRAALQSLRTRVQVDRVTQLAMPRIGCGLDGLVWEDVRALLREVFAGTGVTISVYTL